ncbi:MAG: ABC transporter ATP-binding protein [Chloroflexota bacterium]
MLTVSDVSVSYGHLTALRELSLTVADKEIVTVIGANGAGKSTLLKAIAGLVPIAGGSIHLDERVLSGLAPHQRVGLGLGYVPEGRELFAPLSVLDNLLLGAYRRRGGLSLLGDIGWFSRLPEVVSGLDYVFTLFPRLEERKGQLAGSLSGGEQQMLAIGRALMSRPRLLLLDEPSLGLAPNLVREIMLLLRRLREEGLAILLVEQDAVSSLKIADRAVVLERGRVTAEGTARDIMRDDRVRQAYLGKVVI